MIIMLILIGPKLINAARKTISTVEKEIYLIKEIETDYQGVVTYKKMEEGILQYWDGILAFYDLAGIQKWHIFLGITNPMIKTNSNNIYVVDNSKNQLLRIGKNGEIIYRYASEEALKNFEVCEENYVILQYPEKNKLTKLTILNQEGREHSNFSLTEGAVISLAISKKHDFVAVNTLKSNNTIESSLLTYDTKGQLIGSTSLKDQLVLGFLYDSKGNLIAVKEEEVLSINKTNKILWNTFVDRTKLFKEQPFRHITFYSGESGKNPLIHTKGGEKVKIIQYNGNVVGETTTEESILGIDVNEKAIAAYSLRTIYLLDERGIVEMEHKYSSDIEEVFIFSKEHVVVVTKGKVAFMRIIER